MKLKPYLLSLLATAFPNALGFLAFPLYAKSLGPVDYGMVALLEAYQGVLSILLFVGMTTAFYVFYSHAKDELERRQIFTTAAFFGLWILAFAMLVALFSSPLTSWILPESPSNAFVAMYAFGLFSDYILTLVNTYLRVEGKIGSLAVNGILISLVHHGLSLLAVVWLGGGISSFVGIFFTTKFCALLLASWHVACSRMPLSYAFVAWPIMKKMLTFGAPLILTSLTGWVLLLSDRLFINYYITTADVGVYAVGYKFAMGLWIGIVQPFMTVWEPSLFKLYSIDPLEGYAKLKRDFTRYLAAIVVLYSAFILFIGDLLNVIFAHSDYANQTQIIYLLAGSYFLMAVGEMCASVCRLHKTSTFALYVTLAVMLTKIVFNVALIPNYVLAGAALASVIAEIVSQTIMAGFAVRLTKPSNLFFSAQNALLCSLFCLVELLLFVYPEASLMFKGSALVCVVWVVGSALKHDIEAAFRYFSPARALESL